MTDPLDGILAVLVAAIVNVIVVAQIRRRAHPADTRFLTTVYSATILLRYALAVFLNAFAANSTFAATFWGDSSQYDHAAQQIALKWSGEPVLDPRLAMAVSGYGWVYFVGSIYFVFDRNQLLVQFANGIFGGLTVLVVYAIACDLFERSVGRWAALFMAFFPQMVFWSAGMYKDQAVLLCIALSMYAVLLLRRRVTPGLVVLLLCAVLALMALRFYVAYFVLFAAVGTFLFSQRRGVFGNLFMYSIVVLAMLGALRFVVPQANLELQTSYVTLERLQITREDQARWGRSGYGTEYDVSTPGGALAALPVGLVYLLFAPFPWAVANLRQALTLPETLVWYALMPAFVRGARHAIRHRFRDVLPVLVFTGSLTAAYALMQGNVGTAYRQRTQITMFFFVFMGVGLVEKEKRKLGARAPRLPVRGA